MYMSLHHVMTISSRNKKSTRNILNSKIHSKNSRLRMSRACPRDMPRLPPWQTAAQPPRSPKKVDMSRSLSGCSQFQDEHQGTNSCAWVPYHLYTTIWTNTSHKADSILETSHSQKPSLQLLRVQRSWTSTATRRTKRKGCTKGPSELPLPWISSGLSTEQQRREGERTDRHLQRTSGSGRMDLQALPETTKQTAWARTCVPSPSLHRRVGAGRAVAAAVSWPHEIEGSTKADDGIPERYPPKARAYIVSSGHLSAQPPELDRHGLQTGHLGLRVGGGSALFPVFSLCNGRRFLSVSLLVLSLRKKKLPKHALRIMPNSSARPLAGFGPSEAELFSLPEAPWERGRARRGRRRRSSGTAGGGGGAT